MTPIEKNVRVVDEQGVEYEATYPKRAKGLVKHGRARFTDENTICLARPPVDTEEKMKKDNINEAEVEKIEEAEIEKIEKAVTAEAVEAAGETPEAEPDADETNIQDEGGEITEAKVLAVIERLVGLTERLAAVKWAYNSVSDNEDLPDDYYEAVQSQHGCLNESIRLAFQSIENLNATANRMLDYLEKKRQAHSPISDREYLEFVNDFVANNHTGELPDFVELRKSFDQGKV